MLKYDDNKLTISVTHWNVERVQITINVIAFNLNSLIPEYYSRFLSCIA